MKKLFNFISVLIFFFCCTASYSADYYVEETSKGPVFYQRIEWESTGIVTEYRLFIEKKTETGFVPYENYTTKKNYYDVSLDGGNYRFSVDFYNVLGQKAFTTEWKTFTILEAHKPEIRNNGSSYIDISKEKFSGTFSLKAEDISQKSEFTLVDVKKHQTLAKANKVEYSGDTVNVSFPVTKLPVGNYQIEVKNPGGLTAHTETIKIRDKIPVLVDASFGFQPGVVLYDYTIPDYFDTRLLLNGYARASVLFQSNKEKYGAGLFVDITRVSGKAGDADLTSNIISGSLNFVYEKEISSGFKYPLALQLSAGAGLTGLRNLHYKYSDGTDSENTESYCPSVNLGADVKAFIYKGFYLQGGAEYITTFKIKEADYWIGTVNVLLGVGFQL